MKNAVFWDVTPCDFCENQRFGETCRLHQLLITANVVLSSLIHFALIMETMRSPETSVFTRSTRRHIPEDGILHSHRHGTLKSYLYN
jgi:hypothetical protein